MEKLPGGAARGLYWASIGLSGIWLILTLFVMSYLDNVMWWTKGAVLVTAGSSLCFVYLLWRSHRR